MVQKNKILSGVLGVVFIVFLFLGKSFSQTHPSSGVLFQNTSNSFFIPKTEQKTSVSTNENKIKLSYLRPKITKKGKQTTANQLVLSSSIFSFSSSNDTKNQLIASANTKELKNTGNSFVNLSLPSKHAHPNLTSTILSLPLPPTSNTSGAWSSATTWGGSVPTATDAVVIANGHSVTVDITTATCQSITIESGGSLIISGTNKLTVTENWTNNGTVDAGTSGTVEFSGSTPTTIRGTTVFEELEITKGDLTNQVIIEGNVTVSGGGSLTLNGGLIQVSSGASLSLENNNQLDIPETGGLEVNGGSLTTGNFSIVNEGLIRINSGTVNFGTGSGNEVHTQVDGAFDVLGGTVDISGRLENTAGGTLDPPGIASGINISGGTVTLSTVGNGASDTGSLDISSNGDFSFSGGTIVFENASSATSSLDLGFADGSGTKTITNGVFKFGNASTTSNSTFVIDSEIPIPNIVTSDGIDLSLASPLVITDLLDLGTDSRLELNGHSIQLAISPNGTYDFPLTDGENSIPLKVQITGGNEVGNATLSVSTSGTKHPENANINNFLNRNWTIDITDITNLSYDVIATYAPTTDITGTESAIAMGTYNGSLPWVKFADTNTTAHTISATGLTDPSIAFSGITSDPPTVSVSATDETICSGNSTTLTATASGDPALNYSWTSTPTGVTSTNPTINVSPTANTTYEVTVTDGNGFTAQDAIEIQVNPLPTASISGATTVCQDDMPPQLIFTAAGGTEPYTFTYNINGGSSQTVTTTSGNTATVSAPTNTTGIFSYNLVSVQDANTCQQAQMESAEITINPTPTVDVISNKTYCDEELTSAISLSGTPAGVTYDISGGASLGLADQTNVTEIPSFTATNATTSPITATVTVTPKANGCSGTPETFIITVNPLPTASISGTTTVCQNDTPPQITFTAAGGTEPYNFTYNIDGGSSQTATTTSGNTATVDAPTNTAGTFSYNLISVQDANTCQQSQTGSASITVNPTPTAINPGDRTYCLGETTSEIMLSGTPSNVVFDITGGVSIGLNDQTDVSKIPSFIAREGSVTLQITPKANGCTGATILVVINVFPLPNIQTPTSSQTICSGETTNINLSSSTPGATFSWVVVDAGTVTGASDGTGELISQTLENKTTSISDVTYQITANANNCEGATRDFTVTVHPEVTATISGGDTFCQNDAQPDITFTANGGTPPYTFTYNINGGVNQEAIANSGNSVMVGVPTDVAGTFNYNLVSAAGSTNCPYPQSASETIIINPQPTLTSSLTPPGVCSNEAFNYIPTSNVAGTTFSWTRAAVPGISNPSDSGTDDPGEFLENTTSDPIPVTYTYTLESTDNCINTENVTVMITPTPHLTSATSGLSICSGTTFSYFPTSDVSGTNFPWTRAAVPGISNPTSSGTGNPNEVLINTTSSPQGVTYIYTLESNDCENPVTYSVSVVVVPAPTITANVSETEICPGDNVNLFSSSDIANTQPPILLSEEFNSASIGATTGPNGWTTINNSTGGNVSNVAWTIRPNNYDRDGKLRSNDNTRFYFSDSDAQGEGSNTNTSLISPSINTIGYTNLQLDFYHHFRYYNNSSANIEVSTDGSNWTTIQSYNYTRGNQTSFQHETISLNGYIGNTTLYIRFRYQASWGWYWAIDNVSVTGTPASAANISWTSSPAGFTSTEANPTNVSPTETTTYTVTYTDPDTGCDGSASTTVTVYPEPDATIHANYCVNAPKIRLTTGTFASYDWQPLPYGETNGNPYIDIDIAGIYTVNVTDANGCTGTASINVSNEYVTNGSFELGNTGFTTDYWLGTNLSAGNRTVGGITYYGGEGYYAVGSDARNYHSNFWGWDHTVHDGNPPNNFLIVNGVGNTLRVWEEYITVEPNTNYYFSAWALNLNDVGPNNSYWPRLQFFINGQPFGSIAELQPGITGSSQNNPWLAADRFYGVWPSGNNTNATITIRQLNTEAGGNDFGIDDISFGILDPSPAEINPSSNAEICSGDTIKLHANVSGGKEPVTYLWEFPNGETSTDKDPVIPDADITYDGTYTLTVSDWYGCDIPSETVDVIVHPQATVNAGEDQSAGCSANNAFILNGTRGGSASSATWTSDGSGTFDDPNSLTTTYYASNADIIAETVTLTLTTDDPDGPCSSASDDLIVSIHPSPEITLDINHPPCYGENTGSATANVTNGTAPFNYLWSDGQTTQTATGLTVGTYSVTVTDANSCTDTETFDIIEPDPLVSIPASFTPPSCYGGNDGTATINVSGGTEPYVYEWDAAAGNQTTQTATDLAVGTYMFTVTDINGCNITTDFVLVTQPDPSDLICPPDPDPVQAAPGETTAEVTLEDPTYDDICQTISWTMSGATVVSTPVDGVILSPYTFNAGTTTVEYTTVNTAGDPLTCSFDVVVIPNDPPAISCVDPAGINATTDQCSTDLTIGFPTITQGENISWEWQLIDSDGVVFDSGTGAIPDPYTFNVGETTIRWVATNASGTATCDQLITVLDEQPPTLIAPTPLEECVESLFQAVYNSSTTDINPDRPEYYLFEAGNTGLDINATNFADNCDLDCDIEIRWRIDFSDGSTLPELPDTYITGQPSTYGIDIAFPGDGTTFTTLVHTITYWIVDCNNNVSAPTTTTITVKPRPNITKMN